MNRSTLSLRRTGALSFALIAALSLAACSSASPDTTASSSTPTSASATGSVPSSSGTSDGATGSATPSSTNPAPESSVDDSAQIIPSAPKGAALVQAKPEAVKDDSGIKGVLAWNTAGYPGAGNPSAGTLEHQHVTTPVTYAVLPPVGGPHAPIWMNAGVYTKPVPSERAVHVMEHGGVWITYNPSLAATEVKALQDLVGKQKLIEEQGQAAGAANRYIVLSPWASDQLPSPIVISAWGHQLRVDSASDPRLQQFIDTFRVSQKYSPELGSPVDGVPTGTGGNPALYGSAVPNPEGTLPDNQGM